MLNLPVSRTFAVRLNAAGPMMPASSTSRTCTYSMRWRAVSRARQCVQFAGKVLRGWRQLLPVQEHAHLGAVESQR